MPHRKALQIKKYILYHIYYINKKVKLINKKYFSFNYIK